MRKRDYTNDELKAALQTPGRLQNEALTWIYQQEKWRLSVQKIVQRSGGEEEDVDEVFQQGIAIFARNLMQGKFREQSAPLTYFVAICKFCFLKRLKKVKDQQLDASIEELEHEPEPENPRFETEERTEEQRNVLRLLMGKLKENCQRILEMYSLNYSMEEIAIQMDFEKTQSAKTATMRCRKKLRALIEEDEIIYNKVKTWLWKTSTK